MMIYSDFHLRIELLRKRYRAFASHDYAGEGAVDFRFPFSEQELQHFLRELGHRRKRVRAVQASEMEAAKVFGERLFDAVFHHQVRDCLVNSSEDAARRRAGLRIRLNLTNAPALADLPWEFLYDAGTNQFLSLSKETPIVRSLALPIPIKPLAVTPPLRVLVMIASPRDLPALEVEREWKNLHDALQELERRNIMALERLEQATLAALQQRLLEQDYHIFHFIGHGNFNTQSHDGVLMLEDERKRAQPVNGEDLGELFHDESTLRLAILNACEGARASHHNPFSGVAQSLMQKGVPAVIAMQFEVTDEAAIAFAHKFYSVVAGGYPIDTALTETRKAIKLSGNVLEWATPVLYMRSRDGKIFDIETPPAVKTEIAPPEEKKPQPPERLSWEKLYASQIQLSLLYHLDNLPSEHTGLTIAGLQKALRAKKRGDIATTIREMERAGLVSKTKRDQTYWKISEEGREGVKKLKGWAYMPA